MPERFNYVKKGYSPEEVDKYIGTLEEVISSYKEKDTAIKNAFINAQIAADNIVKNAELAAEEKKRGAIRQFNTISESIVRQKEMVKEFQDDYNNLVKKYLVDFGDKDIDVLITKINALENYIESLKNPNGQTEG